MEQPQTPRPTTNFGPPNKPKRPSKLLSTIIIGLLVVGGAGAYWWRNDKAEKQHKTDEAKISALQTEINALKVAENESPVPSTEVSTKVPTASVKQSVIDSIKSGNTAALEGYMASTVSVIVAASEGIGNRTPAQAVSDLVYLNDAIDPWNFGLSASTLNGYQTGDYKIYFKSNSVVGKSADGMVISFTFNSAGKISGIFMSASDDLL